ncbi:MULTISPECIES: hypothetical protein [Nostoc]|uniref:Uncharacterized protein n=1 Tax=Nostoc paludosum FACHB-159 TaxID=2692908 RepID=A0ABR8KGK7_9NOSO|nr:MULTISPECIES: hypothetical protein [Nostoc]MBD2681557.1 hypothetical protein [Nostoc sp. FACHB-857]MBD2738018.1 hypothetical protein [Nostoc paludosum FACHB-159]
MKTKDMVSIKEVCELLEMPEEIIRLSLQESHPDDFDSLKEISFAEFETLVQILKQKAEQENNGQVAAIAPSTNNTLPVPEQQKIINGALNALSEFAGNYTLTIDKITSTLAFISGQSVVNNFVHIHSNTIRNGLEDYLDELAGELTAAAHSIKGVDAKDFLAQRGITPKQRTVQKSLEEIMNLAANI